MIEPLKYDDARPVALVDKINEVIEWINGFVEVNELDNGDGVREGENAN